MCKKPVQLRILDEDVENWKRSFPNLSSMWALTDEEVVQLCAADRMSKTFGSKPVDWVVRARNVCDESVLGWRVEIAPEHQYPISMLSIGVKQ